MKSLRSIIFFIALIPIASCYKDLGNYDYKQINKLGIQLESSYNASYGVNFKIEPIITASADNAANLKDTSKYKYEWSVLNPSVLYADQRRVISVKPVLDDKITVNPGAYTLYLRVTDRNTGVMFQQTAKFTVISQIYEGWLLLNEAGGKSRLDMLSRVDSNYTYLPDVLTSVESGLDMSGTPVDVAYSANAGLLTTTLAPGIYVTTSNGTNRIDNETFKWTADMNIRYQFLSVIPSNFVIDNVYGAGSEEFMHSATDGNMYYYYRIMQTKYGIPVNIIAADSSKPFRTSKYFVKGGIGSSLIMYDTDHKRFVRAASNSVSAMAMPNDNSYFNYNTGKDLKYMQYSPYGNGEVFAVLYDTNTQKYFLARFTNGASITQTYYSEITAESFNNAENFAVDPTYGYLFYNVGGKIYEYDMGLKQSFLMADKGNKKITVLKYHRFLSPKYTSGTGGAPILANKLIVCSYDPSDSGGKGGSLELYNVPQVNGQLTLAQSFTSLGKIVSLTYRER